MALSPGGLIAWIVVGVVAGWITGKLMRGRGYGIIGDLIVGLIGAVIGGYLVGLFTHTSTGFLGSIVVAVLGAILLVAVVRALAGSRSGV